MKVRGSPVGQAFPHSDRIVLRWLKFVLFIAAVGNEHHLKTLTQCDNQVLVSKIGAPGNQESSRLSGGDWGGCGAPGSPLLICGCDWNTPSPRDSTWMPTYMQPQAVLSFYLLFNQFFYIFYFKPVYLRLIVSLIFNKLALNLILKLCLNHSKYIRIWKVWLDDGW